MITCPVTMGQSAYFKAAGCQFSVRGGKLKQSPARKADWIVACPNFLKSKPLRAGCQSE